MTLHIRTREASLIARFLIIVLAASATLTMIAMPVEAQAARDISVVKSDSPDPVSLGETLTYQVTVTNLSGGSAAGVRVTDTVPGSAVIKGFSWSHGGPSGCSQSGQQIICNIGTLGGSATARVTITVTPMEQGTITNTVVASTTDSDSNLTNNTDSEPTVVGPPEPTDLSVVKTDSPDPAPAGGNIVYRVTVTNSGGFAEDVKVTDTVSSGLTIQSFSWTRGGTGACQASGSQVTCTFGDMADGDTGVLIVTATAVSPGTVTNTAVANTSSTDSNPANNSDTESTTVQAPPPTDVAISKGEVADPVQEAGTLVYQVTVTVSSGPALNLRVTDTLPSEVRLTSFSWSFGGTDACGASADNTRVFCSFGDVPSSTTIRVTITVRPLQQGTITNQVQATTSSPDSSPSNNQDSETTNITAPSSCPAGSPPYFAFDIVRDIELLPNSDCSGYILDGAGGVHPFGLARGVIDFPQFGVDIARDLEILGDRTGYVLDGHGGVHRFGDAPAIGGAPYFGFDIARDLEIFAGATKGYILDGYGALHSLGSAAPATGTPYFPGFDIARDAEVISDGKGHLLDGYGAIHSFGGAARATGTPYFPGFDIARDIEVTSEGAGYLLDGYGAIHSFGGTSRATGTPYFPGFDIARGIALRASGESGYLLDGRGGIHIFNI